MLKHKLLRKPFGQSQWVVRQRLPELAVRESQLAALSADPKVLDLIEANRTIKAIRARRWGKWIFRPLNLEEACVLGVSDAAFDNLHQNSKSDRERIQGVHCILFFLYPCELHTIYEQACKSVDRIVGSACLQYTSPGASSLCDIICPCSSRPLAVESQEFHSGASCESGDLNLSSSERVSERILEQIPLFLRLCTLGVALVGVGGAGFFSPACARWRSVFVLLSSRSCRISSASLLPALVSRSFLWRLVLVRHRHTQPVFETLCLLYCCAHCSGGFERSRIGANAHIKITHNCQSLNRSIPDLICVWHTHNLQ